MYTYSLPLRILCYVICFFNQTIKPPTPTPYFKDTDKLRSSRILRLRVKRTPTTPRLSLLLPFWSPSSTRWREKPSGLRSYQFFAPRLDPYPTHLSVRRQSWFSNSHPVYLLHRIDRLKFNLFLGLVYLFTGGQDSGFRDYSRLVIEGGGKRYP